MKVTFIKHSCYLVELENRCLLFDYYDGELPPLTKPVTAFASHHHGDHFSKKLFDACPQANYILSGDIFRDIPPEGARDKTLFVSPHQSYQLDDLEIGTLESTDAGVAFLIRCEGKTIYHAGDLNCWVWDGAPKVQNEMMKTQYRRELSLLSGKEINVAFVPLDPRQEKDFDMGLKLFFETAQAKYVFPMHMWGDHSVVPRFKADPANQPYAARVMDVTGEGQEFLLN